MNINLNNSNANMPSNSNYGEKEVLNEALTTEKSTTGTYNTFVNECANPQLRSDLMQILNTTHKMQSDIFNEMQNKGMYQPCQAEQQKISQAKQKYSQQVK
jgi:spore coat protein CotF